MSDLGTMIIPVSGMALIVVQLLTTPFVMATSPSQGRRWRSLCPLRPGCWSTPKGKGSPEPQFPFHDYLNLAGLRGPTLGRMGTVAGPVTLPAARSVLSLPRGWRPSTWSRDLPHLQPNPPQLAKQVLIT